jgi:hypothetical protein
LGDGLHLVSEGGGHEGDGRHIVHKFVEVARDGTLELCGKTLVDPCIHDADVGQDMEVREQGLRVELRYRGEHFDGDQRVVGFGAYDVTMAYRSVVALRTTSSSGHYES